MAIDESTKTTISASVKSTISSTSGPTTRKVVVLPKPNSASAPELSAFLHVLLLSMLVHAKAWTLVRKFSLLLIDALVASNRRTCDFFSTRVYSYLTLAVERERSSINVKFNEETANIP